MKHRTGIIMARGGPATEGVGETAARQEIKIGADGGL